MKASASANICLDGHVIAFLAKVHQVLRMLVSWTSRTVTTAVFAICSYGAHFKNNARKTVIMMIFFSAPPFLFPSHFNRPRRAV